MMMRADARTERVHPEGITIPERLRQMDSDRVEALAESMQKIGLQTPITVHTPDDGESVVLIAGRHRLEAALRLGWDYIQAIFVEGTSDDFRLWEIAENLHRAELTVLERSRHIAEWIRITDRSGDADNKPGQLAQVSEAAHEKDKLAQVEPVSKGGRGNQAGVRAASRKLGVERNEAQRAIKIDSITPEAEKAVREAGLDKNQSALLKVASAPKEEQVAAVEALKAKKEAQAEERKTGIARRVVEVIEPGQVGAGFSDALPRSSAARAAELIRSHFRDDMEDLIALLRDADMGALRDELLRR